MRDTLRTCCEPIKTQSRLLKTLNPTPGHEQKFGRFIGSLWAMNPGHLTTNEKFA